MLVEVKVPQLSESVAEATLLAWHKKAGEAVKRDENLIDIETDKVVLELPAPADGVLSKIIKGDGGTVVAGEVIATIDTEAKASSSSGASSSAAAPAAPAGVRAEPKSTPATPPTPAKEAREDARLMPAARKLVEEQGIDPSRMAGSGRDGRIIKADVLAESAKPSAPAPAAEAVAPAAKPLPAGPTPVDIDRILGDRPEQRVPMSRLRARIAERLVQSQSTAAILTTFNEVNMQPVIELRRKHQERFEKEHGVRLGFMSFFVKAAVYALKKYPVVNASIDGNEIVYHGYFDVGVAVGSPRGLVVPILRDCDQMTFAEIESKIADFGKRAQDGKLMIEELTGGTFSISNGGVFGSTLRNRRSWACTRRRSALWSRTDRSWSGR
jgi:2-oxoglutarate dehydrogenase E2 component (dihydrolipoamide succinyltransferase)